MGTGPGTPGQRSGHEEGSRELEKCPNAQAVALASRLLSAAAVFEIACSCWFGPRSRALALPLLTPPRLVTRLANAPERQQFGDEDLVERPTIPSLVLD
jgi:hypothetical protein